ncbi:MAG: OmpA family protein [Pseudomonadota bacterium]|nr:OmpA family protein [Pseudomonadota bacterium]
MPALLLIAALAHAEPSSADIELVTPSFAAGSVPGAESGRLGRAGSVRVGSLVQYALAPLVYREGGEEVGAAVAHRASLQLGVSWDVTRRFALRGLLPVAVQAGSDDVAAAASGFGAGDLGVGARVALLDHERFGLAARADVRFPTGTPNAWLGEANPRGILGVDFSASAGPVGVMVGAGGVIRAPVATPDDFTLGSEIAGDAAVRLRVVPKRLAVHVAAVARVGLSAAGAAEVPAEVLLGAQWTPSKTVQLDLGVGHGLSTGYGSSRFRALAGFTFVYSRPRPTEVAAVTVGAAAAPPEEEDFDQFLDAVDEPPPPPEPEKWAAGELARVENDQITIREPIRFGQANDEILPESRPLLEAIALRLKENPGILEVVIEGHSSEEGDFAVNYALSMKRATSVLVALVEAGVDAQRLAIRGLGEVKPAGADAAENRRVVFHIVRRAAAGETKSATTPVPVPWTGASR